MWSPLIVVRIPEERRRRGGLETPHALPVLVLAGDRRRGVSHAVEHVVEEHARVVQSLVHVQPVSPTRKQRRDDGGLRVVRVGGGGPGPPHPQALPGQLVEIGCDGSRVAEVAEVVDRDRLEREEDHVRAIVRRGADRLVPQVSRRQWRPLLDPGKAALSPTWWSRPSRPRCRRRPAWPSSRAPAWCARSPMPRRRAPARRREGDDRAQPASDHVQAPRRARPRCIEPERPEHVHAGQDA